MKTVDKFLKDVIGTSFDFDKVSRDSMCWFNQEILERLEEE